MIAPHAQYPRLSVKVIAAGDYYWLADGKDFAAPDRLQHYLRPDSGGVSRGDSYPRLARGIRRSRHWSIRSRKVSATALHLSVLFGFRLVGWLLVDFLGFFPGFFLGFLFVDILDVVF